MIQLVPLAILLGLASASALGQAKPVPFQPPDDLHYRPATALSEGTRLGVEVFVLKSLDGQKLPTLLLCHGWGGTAAALRPEAIAFARAGYLVVTFDYRGWGASDGRLLSTGSLPT